MKRVLLSAILMAFLSLPAFAFEFTGNAAIDFSATQNCLVDVGGIDGLDVGMPSPVQNNISGFDIEQVCFFYDSAEDALYVGIQTFEDVIFGDADGDGDPAGVAPGYTGQDFADLGSTESLVLAIDLDGDSLATAFDASTIDSVIGVSSSANINDIGAFTPAGAFNPFNPAAGFGSTRLVDVLPFTSPDAAHKDLEFRVDHFSSIASFARKPVLMIFAGSTAASGIGADFLPDAGEAIEVSIFDGDEDTLNDDDELTEGTNSTDPDSDDDALTDGTEVHGQNPTDPLNPDTDGDTCLDGTEDANHDGTRDATESDPNIADTDADALGDCIEVSGNNPTNPTDADSDDDTCTDGEEDLNHNGNLDEGESNPNIADTDGGGVTDCIEINSGFDPNDPSDDDAASQATGALPAGIDQVQGGGMKCSLSVHAAKAPIGHAEWLLSLLTLLLFMRVYRAQRN